LFSPRQDARWKGKGARCRLAVAVAVALAAPLAGCLGGGLGLGADDKGVDPTLTSSVDDSYAALKNSQSVSDQVTIRNAVSAANLEALGPEPLAWANAETRSRGAITDLVETRSRDVLCRAFRTSRESFDGVAIFAGEACLGRDGAWYMRSFAPS